MSERYPETVVDRHRRMWWRYSPIPGRYYYRQALTAEVRGFQLPDVIARFGPLRPERVGRPVTELEGWRG